MKKINKKNIAICFMLVSFAGSIFCQTQNVTEASLYNEINSAYATGFLPGVIEKASGFERQYPESAYINDVRLQKARALVRAGQNDSAIETLASLKESPETYFLLGRAYYEKGMYKNALNSFYKSAKLMKTTPDGSDDSLFYGQSLLYAGRIYFNTDDYKAAIPNFEYVVSNGNRFSQADFNEALQKLIISYNETNQGKNRLSFFQIFPNLILTPSFIIQLPFMRGRAMKS